MRILVTNDDGWSSPGLRTLVEVLATEGHDVDVVAPDVERSGSGTALGRLDDGFEFAIDEVEVPGATRAWSLSAPPAMCVLVALSAAVGTRPDLVLSGINAGHNTGRNIVHSGTFGAAWMAARVGLPAAAVSSGPLPGARFDTAARVVAERLDGLVSMPAGSVLNVNVPDSDYDVLGPIIETKLARAGMQRVEFSRNGDRIRVIEAPAVRSQGDTDAVLDGAVSVTAIEARMHLGSVPLSVFPALTQSTPQEANR